ncbi:MAG: hypothetical protein ABSB35_17025 [Bryobacteraceae bacterium]
MARSMVMGLAALSLSVTVSAATPPASVGNPGKSWERCANPEAAAFRSSALEAG